MAAFEEVCIRLPAREADEIRFDSCCMLRDHCPPSKYNITAEEHRTIKELREEQSRVVLTNQTTQTRHFHFLQTLILSGPSTRTPP